MATSKSNKTTTAAKDKTKNIPTKTIQPTVKPEETKKAETKKAEPKKEEPKVAAKPAVKATESKATAEVKKTARKTASKAPRKTSKATIRKAAAAVDWEVFVQIYGQEFSQQEIMQKVVAAWEAEGKKIASIKRAKLYIKPEEGKAYYVVNEGLKNGSTGAVDL